MAKMSSELELRDGFSAIFNKFNTGIDKIVSSMNNAEASSDSVDFDMPNVNSSAKKAAENVENLGKKVNNLNNKPVNKLTSGFSGLSQTIITVNQGLELVKKASQFLNGKIAIADEMTLTYARLNLINDGMQTTAELQNMIYESAERARGSYSTTAQAVSKLGILAKDAFSSNKEIIDFAEQMNKQFAISGSSIEEQKSAMYQLTQAMAAGKLQGDEFRSIMENAPLLAQSIADRMGLSTGQLKEMSSQGVITADIIKQAMFSSAEETNRKFAELPVTFGQITQSLKNQMLMAFDPLIQQFSQFVNSEQGKQLFADLANAAIIFANACLQVFEISQIVYNFFSNNWTLIGPILLGVVTAFLALAVIIKTVSIAQAILNAVMMANPFVLIIVAIVGLIAAFITLWKTNINFKVGVIGIWNSILNFFDKIPVFFMKVGYGIADAFSYAKQYSLLAIQKLANGAIDIINWVIKKLNKLPGVSIDLIDNATFGTEVALEEEAKRQQRAATIAEAENKVAEKAAQREAKLQADEEKWRKQAEEQETQAQDQGNTDTDLYGNEDNGVYVNGGKLDSPIDLSTQTLKYLNDIAEKQALQQLDTLYVANDDVTLSQSDSDLLSSQTGSKANVYYLQYQGGVNMQTEVTQGDTWETIKKKAKEETDSELEIGLSDLDKVVCPS